MAYLPRGLLPPPRGKPFFSFELREPFDGVAQRSARHLADMRFEEATERGFGHPLADLAQHPPDGLVDQILIVAEQELGDREHGSDAPARIEA